MILYYVAAAVVYVALCFLVAFLGRNRKWGYWGYLWSSVLFTPLFGVLFVLAADPPPRRKRYRDDPPSRAE
jgi:hypothetical protein